MPKIVYVRRQLVLFLLIFADFYQFCFAWPNMVIFNLLVILCFLATFIVFFVNFWRIWTSYYLIFGKFWSKVGSGFAQILVRILIRFWLNIGHFSAFCQLIVNFNLFILNVYTDIIMQSPAWFETFISVVSVGTT